MGEVGLDLDFATDLTFDATVLELGFVEDFESADKARGSFFCEVDATELSFPEGFADFEHA